MWSCYKPGKILSSARWERTTGRRIWVAKLSEPSTKCREEKETRDETKYHDSFNVDRSLGVTERKSGFTVGLSIAGNCHIYGQKNFSLLYLSCCYLSTVITFSAFPENWIIFTRFIRLNDGLLDSTVESFSIDDGSKNVTIKMNYPFFHFFSRLFQIAENVKSKRMSLSWFLGDRPQV